MATAKKKTRNMSDDHKAALAEGRNQGRAIRQYLEALEAHKPKRGRKRTPESIAKQLDAVNDEIPTADPMKRLTLIQQRIDLEKELANTDVVVDLSELEDGFIAAAKDYSARKNITYAAWRELGVSASVLKAAGISRSGS